MSNLLNIVTESAVSASANDGNADFRAVTKSILKTQPPRFQDIPDMVAFVKVYGGMPSGVFIKSLSYLVKHFMPDGRIVSGAFFKMMADVHMKFSTNDQPAHLINAMVLVHACNDFNQDGFARYITKVDVGQVTNPKQKHVVKEANDLLSRAMKLYNFERDSKERLTPYYMLCSDLIDVVCKHGKSDEQGKDLTCNHCAAMFSKRATPEGITDTLQSNMSSITPKPCTNAITYDEHGNVDALGRQTLTNKGFKVNQFVVKKKESKTAQYKIVDIFGDGSVQLRNVSIAGVLSEEATNVDMDTFISTYITVVDIEFVKEYPNIDASFSKLFEDLMYKGVITIALKEAMRKFPCPDARIMIKPTKGVYLNKDYKASEYVIAPATTKITIERRAEVECPDKAVVATCSVLMSPRVFLCPDGPTEHFAAQFWSVTDNDDEAKCNCKFVSKVFKFRAPSDEKQNRNEVIEITIPVIENFKDVTKDDEIIVLKAAAPKKKAQKTAQRPYLAEPTTKKRKA